jgi:hypothetical protein
VQSVLPAVEFALERKVGIIILIVVLVILVVVLVIVLLLIVCDRHCTLGRWRRWFPLLLLPLLMCAPRLPLRVALSAFGGSDEGVPQQWEEMQEKK